MSAADGSFKVSVMIPETIRSFFHQYIETIATASPSIAEFTTFQGTYLGRSLVLYQSGIFIYQPSDELEHKITQFFTDHGINPPTFEYYQDFTEANEETTSTTDHRSILLTEEQQLILESRLESLGYAKLDLIAEHEHARYHYEDTTIIINRNKSVYATGDISVLLKMLDSCINYQTTYQVVGITGHNLPYGPIYIAAIDIPPESLKRLQLEGIKLGTRRSKASAQAELIKEEVTVQLAIIEMEQMQTQEIDTLLATALEPWVIQGYALDTRFKWITRKAGIEFPKGPAVPQVAYDFGQIMSDAMLDDWLDEWSHKLNYRLSHQVILALRNHPQAQELFKPRRNTS